MSKIPLIIKREYLSRVKNRAFILTTILTPLLFVGLIFGAAFLSIAGKEKLKIAVVDDNGYFKNNIKSDSNMVFEYPAGVDTSNYADKGYSAFLHITPIDGNTTDTFIVRSEKAIGLGTAGTIEDKLNAAIEDNMLQKSGILRTTLDSIHKNSRIAKVTPKEVVNGKAKESNQELAGVVGYVSGTLIYITLLIYGTMLMRGVMEEKTNRIAEVIVSSVKPFELMLGKIIGIGAVGLTQFVMWIGLIIIFTMVAQGFLSHDTVHQAQVMHQPGSMPGGVAMPATNTPNFADNLMHAISTANWPLIAGCFIFYFLGGYLLYAALFAAIGCVVEDVQSSQSLTLPVTMPVIFSFIIGINAVAIPNSPLAVWASMIPLSSPIVMMCRIAYGVPYWQIIVSMVSLVAGFLFTTWLAAKIYRTGILMYGKKTTWKEMFKWAFRKN